MTDKEKAKAYDETLNKAKVEISTKGIGETVNLCYQLFPQLAESEDEESDDERIRKWLYDLVDEGAYLCERPFATESILAYLEKQKKCVAGSSKTSADEAERIIEGFKGLLRGIKEKGGLTLNMVSIEKCEAWLEKQKEPKSSALQDAYEHSVKDYSLEEKSKASDYADRILPTSVIYGESEEEYKLHKIIEAAFIAGQKEQKPNIELIQRSWYMEGYHDREFGKEPKWILKTGEGGPKHELNPRYGQPLVEEQKPTEEQLHNLNEAIKGLRMDGCERMADSLHSLYDILLKRNKEQEQELPLMGGDTNTYFDDLRMTTKPLTSREWFDEGIKYAQRLQKEQKHNYCLYGGDPSVGRCRWCSAACSARLADVHTDEEKEYIRTIKSIISDFIRDKKPENLAYYQRIYDWLDGRHVPFSCGHENGEPADPEAMKRNKQFDELLARVPEETKRRVDRQLSCKWLRNGNECGKGLPGTPCEIVGCVAWQHYKED